ncbi:hypothetical protein BJ165DRAFT_130008 [Panaeolus papilionaceus]|nr:hypothetical protein BJ165DRAFT_130008 [Panaeolus papilionaceus]
MILPFNPNHHFRRQAENIVTFTRFALEFESAFTMSQPQTVIDVPSNAAKGSEAMPLLSEQRSQSTSAPPNAEHPGAEPHSLPYFHPSQATNLGIPSERAPQDYHIHYHYHWHIEFPTCQWVQNLPWKGIGFVVLFAVYMLGMGAMVYFNKNKPQLEGNVE